MSKLLINENPLQILPTLAEAIGLNNAIILQQVHYWLENAKKGKNKHKFKHGHYWVYNSYPAWQETNFPFWSPATIKRIFLSLEEDGYLISGQFEGNKRRKWYTIDYAKLQKLEINLVEFPPGQNDLMETDGVKMTPSIGSKCAVPSGHFDPVLNKVLTENTTETTTDIKDTPKRDPRIDHPAIVIYRDTIRRQVPIIARDEVIETVGEESERWETILRTWVLKGYNPSNLQGQLSVFRNGWRRNGQSEPSFEERLAERLEERGLNG